MSLKALTANTAPEENAHLLAEDDAAIFQSMFGEDGVLESGQRMKATVISNNKVRVADGVVCIGGHIARTVYGDYTDLTIENGESGKNRNDLIIGTFSTTGAGGIDTMQLTVKKGAAGTAATDPALTQGNLYTGSKLREVPLWRVKIEGLSITKVEQLFEIVPSIPTLKKELESLNGNISITANGICKKYNNGIMEQYIKVDRNTSDWAAWKYMYYAEVAAVDYIEPFKDITYLDIYLQSNNVAVGQMTLDNGTLAKTSSMYALRPDTANPFTVTVYVHVIGRWK
nr:MAG TPA: hypothetical protein [Caudoviricetes sp.]